MSLITGDTLREIWIAKILSHKQATRLKSLSLQLVLSPASDFGNCVADPVGSYDPSHLHLVPDYEGLFLSVLEFTPPWADEFDSFVVVCRCYGDTRGGWDFALLMGDEWTGR